MLIIFSHHCRIKEHKNSKKYIHTYIKNQNMKIFFGIFDNMM